jgi:GNAT superfamily N-acetyltransferase
MACTCGWQIPGGTVDERLPALTAHMASAHPGVTVGETGLRDYLAALGRMEPPGPRVDVLPPVEVHRVTPERIEDALRFFDETALADNPIWAACYCMAHHVEGGVDSRSAAENRVDQQRRLARGATTAYLAYAPTGPIGWINASRRAEYPDYSQQSTGGLEPVGAIACFVIAAPYRRHGVGRMLLDAAVAGFRAEGVATVEAYPVSDPRSDASAYHGPLQLYLDAGFTEVGPLGNWVLVSRSLL